MRDTIVAWAGLGLLTLVITWPLGLTNRILAGLDAFTYFNPYWAYRMAELRAGHLPLWNPYLFMGVPFLANPQAAVLYPLHWPLIWLPPERALIWSALLHVWLAAGFMYTFARRSLSLSQPAAWLAGVLYGFGGFTLARVENINQLNALAWLPAMLWLYDETASASGRRRQIRWAIALAVVIALQILAGHTQTTFVNLAGLVLYAVYPLLKWVYWYIGKTAVKAPISRLLPLAAILPALLLAGAQLLPSIELNGLGLRTGGLSYRQAVSFSLRPRLLAQTFLPPFGAGLAEAFSSEGYAEFVAYVGIAGIVLAGIGAATLLIGKRRSESTPRSSLLNGEQAPANVSMVGRGRSEFPGALVLLAVMGVFLALGAYNPLYYLLWRFLPGFALFRAPVRWLELFVLGMTGLAGVGLDACLRPGPLFCLPQTEQAGLGFVDRQPAAPPTLSPPVTRRPSFWRPHGAAPTSGALLAILMLAGLVALIAFQQWPSLRTLAGWLAAFLIVGAILWAGQHRPRPARIVLVAFACCELWLAARALPFTLATAPYALSLRNAPAALLAATAQQSRTARDRFISMSDIRFDPGDLEELRALQADRLSPEVTDRLVRAAKQMEVIAPNLSLLLRLPTIDGYDGGLLPTRDYGQFLSLFLPREQLLPDGRLREQLREIPPGRLLDLAGVRFVLTDKQNDLWANDVYYDLEQAAALQPGQRLRLDLAGYPPFSATGLGIVSYLSTDAPQGSVVAELLVTGNTGQTYTLPIRAGVDTGWGQGSGGDLRVAREWPAWTGMQGRDYLARLDFPQPITPTEITMQVPPEATSALVLRGVSLIDGRTGAHTSVTVSPSGDFRRIHSGDVKLYERVDSPGRAWLVHGVQPVEADAAALALLADPTFDPRATAAIVGNLPAHPGAPAAAGEAVTILDYQPEKVVLRATVASPALLVLADTFYPGWQATVDGAKADILRANLMFRAVKLEPGSHEVVFTYRPASWRWGLGITLVTAMLLSGLVGATYVVRRKA